MRRIQHRHTYSWKKIAYSRWTIALLIISACAMIHVLWSAYTRKVLSMHNSARIEQDLVEIKQRKVVVSENIAALKTEDGVEREIRQKFNVIKPGESVFVLVDAQDETSTQSVTVKKSWWQRIVETFGF